MYVHTYNFAFLSATSCSLLGSWSCTIGSGKSQTALLHTSPARLFPCKISITRLGAMLMQARPTLSHNNRFSLRPTPPHQYEFRIHRRRKLAKSNPTPPASRHRHDQRSLGTYSYELPGGKGREGGCRYTRCSFRRPAAHFRRQAGRQSSCRGRGSRLAFGTIPCNSVPAFSRLLQ